MVQAGSQIRTDRRIRTWLQEDLQLLVPRTVMSGTIGTHQDLLTPASMRAGTEGGAEAPSGTLLLDEGARLVVVLVKVRFFTDTKGYRRLLGEQRDGGRHTLFDPDPMCGEPHPLWSGMNLFGPRFL